MQNCVCKFASSNQRVGCRLLISCHPQSCLHSFKKIHYTFLDFLFNVQHFGTIFEYAICGCFTFIVTIRGCWWFVVRGQIENKTVCVVFWIWMKISKRTAECWMYGLKLCRNVPIKCHINTRHFNSFLIFVWVDFSAPAFTIVVCPFSIFNCSIWTTQIANMWHILYCGCPRIYNDTIETIAPLLHMWRHIENKRRNANRILTWLDSNSEQWQLQAKNERKEDEEQYFAEFRLPKNQYGTLHGYSLQLTCRMPNDTKMANDWRTRYSFHLSMMLRVKSAIHLLFGEVGTFPICFSVAFWSFVVRRASLIVRLLGILTQFHK